MWIVMIIFFKQMSQKITKIFICDWKFLSVLHSKIVLWCEDIFNVLIIYQSPNLQKNQRVTDIVNIIFEVFWKCSPSFPLPFRNKTGYVVAH